MIHLNCGCIRYMRSRVDFPGGSDGKESACNVGDPGSIPELGRSLTYSDLFCAQLL